MNRFRKVTSPWEGVILEVFVHQGSYVYEWEPLLLIETKDGTTQEIGISASGNIETLNFKKGDKVTIDCELAMLHEDYLPAGCD